MNGSDRKDRNTAAGSARWLALPATLLTLILSLVILKLGQDVFLPILLAVIAVYVLTETQRALAGLPVIGQMPRFVLRLLILLIFIAMLMAFGLVIEGTLREISDAAPHYEANFEKMFADLANRLGVDGANLWQGLTARFTEWVNIESLIGATLASLGSLGMLLFLVAIYASFMMAERNSLSEKLSRIFSNREDAARTERIIAAINKDIGSYLTAKTVLNFVSGGMSYIVMLLFGVDFALLWALIIALLGYIPYVGAYLGVGFPVLLSLAQFGHIGTTLLLALILGLVQLLEGNWLEPKVIGKKSNLSPFVVLVALASWSALWGMPGAIFAIPLTSMIVIVCSAFESTRWVPILCSHDVKRLDPDPQPDRLSAETR